MALAASEPSTASPPGSHRFFPLPGARVGRLVGSVAGRRQGETAQIPFAAVALRRAAGSFRPDLVHVHFLNWRAAACTLVGLSPLVVSVWGAVNPRDEALDPRANRWRLPRAVLRRCAAAVVESPPGIDACRQLAGPSLRAEAIPLGVDTRVFRPAAPGAGVARRRELGISPDDFVFLSPRGVGEVYGHEQILEAFARARSRIRQRSVLVFVRLPRAMPRAYRRRVTHLVRRARMLGVADDVLWLRTQPYDQMPDLYSMCDAVVNYPSTDSFASTLREAAACGRAIITARLPAYRGTFIEEFATTVEHGQPEALTAALISHADGSGGPGPDRLAAARRAVERDYDESGSRRSLAKLYREIAKESGASV